MTRPDLDTTLMGTALLWEERSTCGRNHVGAVIAQDGRTISTGYNGAPAGRPHCDHGPLINAFPYRRATPAAVPLMGSANRPDLGCRIAVHAEANAIAYAARNGLAIEGCTLYTTLSPCYDCAKLIITAGLLRVVFNRSYRDPAGIDLLRDAGLTVDNMRR